MKIFDDYSVGQELVNYWPSETENWDIQANDATDSGPQEPSYERPPLGKIKRRSSETIWPQQYVNNTYTIVQLLISFWYAFVL